MRVTDSIVINASAERVFKLATDPLLCQHADMRLTAMEVLSRTADEVLVKIRGYALAPLLESTLIVHIRLHPYDRIQVESEPGSISLPGRLAFDRFSAECRFEELGLQTKLTRVESYGTKSNPLGRLVERRGEEWLRRHLREITLPRLKRLMELAR